MSKTPWYDIDPADAVDIVLPNDEVQGPYNENGEECPWPWEPIQLKGVPLGMYHCQYCGAVCVAGMEHTDYGEKDENGLSVSDYQYLDYVREDMRRTGASEEEIDRQMPDGWNDCQ